MRGSRGARHQRWWSAPASGRLWALLVWDLWVFGCICTSVGAWSGRRRPADRAQTMPHPPTPSVPAAALAWGVMLEGPFEGRRRRVLGGGSFRRLRSGARDRHRNASPALGETGAPRGGRPRPLGGSRESHPSPRRGADQAEAPGPGCAEEAASTAGAAAGAAPGSHGRRQVPEPQEALPRVRQAAAAAAAGAAASPRPPSLPASLPSRTRPLSRTGERGPGERAHLRTVRTAGGLPAPGLPAALRARAPRRWDLSCAPSPSPLSLASGMAPRAGWASPSQALLLQPLALGYFGLRAQRAPELGEPG